MAQIDENRDLTPFTTFRVPFKSSYFTVASSISDIKNIIGEFRGKVPILILGEGANVLFTKDFPGLIIQNNLTGQKIISEDETSLTLDLASGESWHNFVMWSVENNLSGIENLALIPGTLGAAPVQNIAAYGQNFSEVMVSLTAIDLESSKVTTLPRGECEMYYRDSIFKHAYKNKFYITNVSVKLSKTIKFDTNYYGRAAYESLAGELLKISQPPYSPKDVATAVIRLRQIKLPDWKILGTGGSFFKNPFVSKEKFASLKLRMPDLQAYPVNDMLYPDPDDPVLKLTDMVKIPAGRLLDELDWKGKRIGNVGTFNKHALIVINYGGATGKEVWEFTQKMQEDVKKNFDIDLESEVNIF